MTSPDNFLPIPADFDPASEKDFDTLMAEANRAAGLVLQSPVIAPQIGDLAVNAIIVNPSAIDAPRYGLDPLI